MNFITPKKLRNYVQFSILFHSDKQTLRRIRNKRQCASEDHWRNREWNCMAHFEPFVGQRFWSWVDTNLHCQPLWIWSRSSDHSAFSWVVISYFSQIGEKLLAIYVKEATLMRCLWCKFHFNSISCPQSSLSSTRKKTLDLS